MDGKEDNESGDPEKVPVPGVKQVTVGEMIARCQEAARMMSVRNENRLLLLNCAFIMNQMVGHIMKLEKQLAEADNAATNKVLH